MEPRSTASALVSPPHASMPQFPAKAPRSRLSSFPLSRASVSVRGNYSEQIPTDGSRSALAAISSVYPEWLANRKDFQELRNQYERLDKIDIFAVCLKPVQWRSDFEKNAVMRFIKSCPFFCSMNYEKISEISNHVHSIKFEPGDKLMTRGEKADCLYIIVTGKVGIYIGSEVAKDEVIEHNVIGESAVQTKNLRTATVKAHTQVEALRLTYADYDHIVFRLKLKDYDDVSAFLKSIDYFSQWYKSKLYRLASIIIVKQYKKGQRIYSIGEDAHDLYIVREGVVSLKVELSLEKSNRWPTKVREWTQVQTKHRYEKSLRECTKGMFFGEHDLITRSVHSTNAICTSDSCLLFIVIEEFFREIFSDKDCKQLDEINFVRPNSGYLREQLEREKRMIKVSSEAMLDAFNMNHLPLGRGLFLTQNELRKAEMARLIVKKKNGSIRKDLVQLTKEEVRMNFDSFRTPPAATSRHSVL